MTNGWIQTVFLIFSCVSAGCGCHYSDEDEGRLVCDQLCQTPLCQTHLRSLFVLPNIPMTSSVCRVRKMSQWCSALSENHKIYAWHTRAGVCLFLVLVEFFIYLFAFFFFVPHSFSSSILLVSLFSPTPLTTCFWWLGSFTNCLFGLSRGVSVFERRTEALVSV